MKVSIFLNEVPLTKAVLVLSPSVPSPLPTTQATDNHSSSSNHKGGLEPLTFSYLRANSCLRENFVFKREFCIKVGEGTLHC